MLKRFKNYGLWASIVSLIGILVRIKFPDYLGDWTDFGTVLLSVLVGAGIISNPKEGLGYLDKEAP